MNRDILKAILIICFFGIFAFVTCIFLSREMAGFGLWLMPALGHLYPIVVVSIILIYSIITSCKIFWLHLIFILGFGLVLECLLFWANKFFFFGSPKVMALFVFGQLVLIYGLTFFCYFYFCFRLPSRKTKKADNNGMERTSEMGQSSYSD